MGYWTNFQFLNTGEELKKIQDVAKKVFKDKLHDVLHVLSETNGTDTKWYDWEEDLVKLSSDPALKDIDIFLRGIGETTCDLWEAKALNGEVIMQRPKIIFPKWGDRELPSWNLEHVDV